jgi:hypothetical protein
VNLTLLHRAEQGRQWQALIFIGFSAFITIVIARRILDAGWL